MIADDCSSLRVERVKADSVLISWAFAAVFSEILTPLAKARVNPGGIGHAWYRMKFVLPFIGRASGGGDAADALRYLVATRARTVAQRKLRGL